MTNRVNDRPINDVKINGVEPLFGAGNLVEFEQKVGHIFSGRLIRCSQTLVFYETGSGNLVEFEQSLETKGDGNMIKYEQTVV